MVWAMAKLQVRSIFAAGHATCILDATNVTKKRRDDWRSEEWDREFHLFDAGEDVCHERAESDCRPQLHPVIARMAQQFEAISVEEPAIAIVRQSAMPLATSYVFDFDGVIHSYESGWVAADVIPDPPVPGALEFLAKTSATRIFSARNNQLGGIRSMRSWLHEQGVEEMQSLIDFPIAKPAYSTFIDDRAFRFEGEFPE